MNFKINQFLSIIICGFVAFSCAENQAQEIPKTEEKVEKQIPVKIEKLKGENFNDYLEVTGVLKAKNEIKIIAEEGGTLVKIRFDKGRSVSKGDTIAVLENKMIEAGYKDAKAALEQAKLQTKSSEVLFKEKAISDIEAKISKLNLERAEAAYSLAKSRFEKLSLVAPYGGFVNDRFYDLGSYVTPMTSVFDFTDNSEMKVSAGVAERFLGDIKVGTPIEIHLDAFPTMKIESKISFVSKSIKTQDRTFQIECKIQNPERVLASQMIADLKLLRKSYQNEIVVPLDALIESETGKFVFLDEANRAKKSVVEILAVYKDNALVKGLEENQNLIVLGHRNLTEGDLLKVVK
ncbi:MAG: efflux RND transporter periplasmic adaptor subunit [Calditrichaeota bacterium]|nr:MAG: efflux RND transporter periplasmic adaptor subunit [Calditrichota bacterium]